MEGKCIHLLECRCNETTVVLDWAKTIGLFDSIEDTSSIAEQTKPIEGLCFVPAFNGLQTPIIDDQACSAFLGIKSNVSPAQMLRAILESIVYSIAEMWNLFSSEMVSHFSSANLKIRLYFVCSAI